MTGSASKTMSSPGTGEQLRDSEIRYRRLFETAKDGILILDFVTRKITDANPFIVELLEYSRDELLGQELWEIGLLKDEESSRQAFRELKEQGYIRYENLPLQTKDGKKKREVEFVSNVYVEDGRQVIQCNIRDITARRQVEQSLRKANDELTALVSELQRRDAEMLLLNRVYELLQACTTQDEAYKVIALVGGELFTGQDGCLAILHASDGYFEPVASWGHEEVEPVFSLEDCWALRRGQLHEVKDPKVGLVCRHFVRQPGAGYLCVPLTVQGKTLGVLSVMGIDARSSEYYARQQQLVVAVGEAIKMSLSNLKLQEKLREEAIRDPLTGLLNRRFLEETLARDVYRAQRRNSPLCVVMLDLDDFKRFNDTFGHHAGDAFLREFGKGMRETVRKSDISCRYGGDEFVLVLPDSSLADAQKRMEDIGVMVKEIQTLYGEPGRGMMTISAGIAQAGVHGSDPAELLRAADKALYAAKAAGRDRVTVYQAKEP